MTARHTLLFRLVGPMQAWGYRSRFEDRDTALEPTRSGVLGLLACACGIPRADTGTLVQWNEALRFGVRVDVPGDAYKKGQRSGFLVETDFHTAQDVLRASGKGRAETVLSRRHYLADGRFTVGLESEEISILHRLESALKNPIWTLCLGRMSFPLALPPWLPGGGIRAETDLLTALKNAPFPLLARREMLPDDVAFVIDANAEERKQLPDSIPMRMADRPLSFDSRQYGVRDVALFRLKSKDCGMEADSCFSQK